MKLQHGRRAHLLLGKRGEKIAAKFLKTKNYKIIEQNWRCRSGELDIVAIDGRNLVFVEVKSRRYNPHVKPADNLSFRQRRRNFNAAIRYFGAVSNPELFGRFDLIEVAFNRLGYACCSIMKIFYRHWEEGAGRD